MFPFELVKIIPTPADNSSDAIIAYNIDTGEGFGERQACVMHGILLVWKSSTKLSQGKWARYGLFSKLYFNRFKVKIYVASQKSGLFMNES